MEAVAQQLICLFQNAPGYRIDISEAVAKLQTGRRRVLDIINGLIAAEMVYRIDDSLVGLTEAYLVGWQRQQQDQALESDLLAHMDELASTAKSDALCIGTAEIRAINWPGPIYVVSGSRDMVMVPANGVRNELIFSGRDVRLARISKDRLVHLVYESPAQGGEQDWGMANDENDVVTG